jgi:hypothetical protein
MPRKLLAALLFVVVCPGAAPAQYTGPVPGTGFDDQQFYWNLQPSGRRVRSQADIDIERRYEETLRNRIPDKKASRDPWAGVRTTTTRTEDRHRAQ